MRSRPRQSVVGSALKSIRAAYKSLSEALAQRLYCCTRVWRRWSGSDWWSCDLNLAGVREGAPGSLTPSSCLAEGSFLLEGLTLVSTSLVEVWVEGEAELKWGGSAMATNSFRGWAHLACVKKATRRRWQ